MLSLHGNKTLTLDLDAVRALVGGELSAFTAVAGFGGKEKAQPRSLISIYVDGQAALENMRINHKPIPVRVPLPRGSRFLTFMVTDCPLDIAYRQLADSGPLGYDAVFLGDPALVPDLAVGKAETLAREVERLSEEIRTAKAEPLPFTTQAELMKGLTLDVRSISGPYPDRTVRPGGQCLRARAWSPNRSLKETPDLSLELSEFTDPCGEATYFRVSDESACEEDELAAGR